MPAMVFHGKLTADVDYSLQYGLYRIYVAKLRYFVILYNAPLMCIGSQHLSMKSDYYHLASEMLSYHIIQTVA